MPRPLYPQETDQVPRTREAGWAQGSVRESAENPTPHQNSIPESQPVSSRHTDCPTPAQKIIYIHDLFIFLSVYIKSW